MMTPDDYMNYQYDMQQRADADYELWILAHETSYFCALCMVTRLLCTYYRYTRYISEYEGMPF